MRLWLLLLPGCLAAADPTALIPATVSGHVFVFGYGGSLVGATVSVAGQPELTTTCDDNQDFALQVPSPGDYSFVVTHDGYAPTQSALLSVPVEGLDMVGFQVPSDLTYSLIAAFVGVDLDAQRCQLVTTVSAAGGPPYGGVGVGEPDVVVTLDPPESAPIYFAYNGEDLPPLPDRDLTASTIDGGVLFANVPPGTYTMSASKAGKVIPPIRLSCTAGMLVNAAPPRGLQVQ